MNKLNSIGLRLQPCQTLLLDLKNGVIPFVSLTERFKLLYILCMIDMKFELNLYLINLYNSPSLQTESYALEKSIKKA